VSLVKIEIDESTVKLAERVLRKHRWLGFDSIDEFVLDTIRQRLELLLSLPDLQE